MVLSSELTRAVRESGELVEVVADSAEVDDEPILGVVPAGSRDDPERDFTDIASGRLPALARTCHD